MSAALVVLVWIHRTLFCVCICDKGMGWRRLTVYSLYFHCVRYNEHTFMNRFAVQRQQLPWPTTTAEHIRKKNNNQQLQLFQYFIFASHHSNFRWIFFWMDYYGRWMHVIMYGRLCARELEYREHSLDWEHVFCVEFHIGISFSCLHIFGEPIFLIALCWWMCNYTGTRTSNGIQSHRGRGTEKDEPADVYVAFCWSRAGHQYCTKEPEKKSSWIRQRAAGY